MSRLGRRRREPDPEVEIDMVPVMNMFLVLIPFLLLSANFLHLKAINASVPVIAQSDATADSAAEPKVVVLVELGTDGVRLSARSEDVSPEQLRRWNAKFPLEFQGEDPLAPLVAHLHALKRSYPASDTVLLIPAEAVLYELIVRTMDAARGTADGLLFPRVVLSGKVG